MTAEYLPVVFSDIICGRGKPGTSRLACITGQRSQVIEARCLNETNFCTKNSLFSSGVALHSSTVLSAIRLGSAKNLMLPVVGRVGSIRVG
jgi:hypothetical protein